MSQRAEKQFYFTAHRRSLRRRLANMPPSKKLELAMFAGMGLVACVTVGLLVA